ncbi:hypothetical protein EYZ11_010718 [Aspergillus tanneri]|uniref:Uncharacterized protein n=1 Tax=Aspergillus tanneri TaxID=1220188 RepID=A0A4S3J4L8_9EURO|nr:hypothetical protein EYZ11_010718 [Aspergillus tanneri]
MSIAVDFAPPLAPLTKAKNKTAEIEGHRRPKTSAS